MCIGRHDTPSFFGHRCLDVVQFHTHVDDTSSTLACMRNLNIIPVHSPPLMQDLDARPLMQDLSSAAQPHHKCHQHSLTPTYRTMVHNGDRTIVRCSGH